MAMQPSEISDEFVRGEQGGLSESRKTYSRCRNYPEYEEMWGQSGRPEFGPTFKVDKKRVGEYVN